VRRSIRNRARRYADESGMIFYCNFVSSEFCIKNCYFFQMRKMILARKVKAISEVASR
jgi:hypothetical protein